MFLHTLYSVAFSLETVWSACIEVPTRLSATLVGIHTPDVDVHLTVEHHSIPRTLFVQAAVSPSGLGTVRQSE
jgi:hypothetical protein